MHDFVANIVLLIYLGIVFIYKLIGYSYFSAAWKALIWIAIFIFLILAVRYGYRWILNEANQTKNMDAPQAEPNENS
ncbi:MAG TPA: hypothetical protein VKA68_12175 [bacterium]|nr:hypothetical protein [bacterium]